MRPRIHYKLTAVFALLAVLFGLLLFFSLLGYYQSLTVSKVRTGLSRQLKTLATLMEITDRRGEPSQWQGIFPELGTNSGTRLTIVNRNGTVVADSDISRDNLEQLQNHSNRNEIMAAWRDGYGEDRRYSVSVGRELIYQAVPVRLGGRDYILRLAALDSDLYPESRDFGKTLVLLLALFAAVIVLLGFFTLSVISRPLERMAEWSRRIAEGKESGHILVQSRDEIGILASSLNDMTRIIGARIADAEISRKRLERMILSMTDGILVVLPDETVLLANDSLKQLLDLCEDPAGRKYFESVRGHDMIELIDRTLKNPGGGEHRQTVVTAGSLRELEMTGIPIRYGDGLDSAVFILHDVTDARRLDAMRKDFVANASHELKTPVAVIKGYAETLLDGALEDREHSREFLKLIHNDAKRLSALIDDILKLSQIESGQLILDKKPFALADTVNRVLVRFRHPAAQNRTRLTADIPPDLPDMNADEDRIEEVLTNLVDNAIKYSGEDATVTVRSELRDKSILVEVVDTGPGIPKDKLSRLFERFYRVDPGRSRKLGGTGLGLSIVKNIVQAHDGNVDVTSRPGEGTVFSFTIPMP